MMRSILIMLLLLAAVYASAQLGEQTMRGFEVPEFDRNNRLTSRLIGDFAIIKANGMVDITGMRIEFYDDQEDVEMLVTADQCLYNRINRDAKSDTAIRIARENLIITGTGFDWSTESGQFLIHADAKVVLAGSLRSADSGLLP
jgi:hypothetical protein